MLSFFLLSDSDSITSTYTDSLKQIEQFFIRSYRTLSCVVPVIAVVSISLKISLHQAKELLSV